MKLSRIAVGQALRAARDAAGLTLGDLAGITSLTTSSLSRSERGERDLTFAEMVEVSEALKIEPVYFYDLAAAFEKTGISEKKKAMDELSNDMAELQKSAIELMIESKHLASVA